MAYSDIYTEKLFRLKASRAGSLSYLTKVENQFKDLLASNEPAIEVALTMKKAVYDQALDAALAACRKVTSIISEDDQFAEDKEEALLKEKEAQGRGELIQDLYDGFLKSHVEASSAPSLQSCNSSLKSVSSSTRQAREADILRERAERERIQADLDKREAALNLQLQEAKIQQKRLSLESERRVAVAEAAAAEASINAQYASICGSEAGVKSVCSSTKLSSAYVKLPTPRISPPKPMAPSQLPLDCGKDQVTFPECITQPCDTSRFDNELVPNSSDIACALAYSSLPKLNAQVFDGNPLEYHQFIRGFDSLFKAVKDPEKKFQFLISCCKGKAYQVIESCGKVQPASRAFQLAREKLEYKFGRVQNIIDAHLAKVADGPSIKPDDIKGLDQLAIDMENCFLTVTEWNKDHLLNNPETLAKIFDRLPERLQLRFHERCADLYGRQEEPTFSHLMKFVSSRVDMADTRLGKRLLMKGCKRQSNFGAGKVPARTVPARVSAFATQGRSPSNPVADTSTVKCFKCKGNHMLWGCAEFKELSPENKQALVKSNRLCFNCLKVGHFARGCPSTTSCKERNCGKRHHTLLHMTQPSTQRQPNVDPPDGEVREANVSSTVCASQTKGKVHLQIAPVTVWDVDMAKGYHTYCFLDPGSDTTLCSTNLMRKLGLMGTENDVVISTVNGSKSGWCYKLSLQVQGRSKGDEVLLLPEVLAVDTLPNLSGSIPSQDDVDRYWHLTGIEFPTCGTRVVELLIGADVIEAHECLEQRRGEAGQPMGILTCLGWTLFGPDAMKPEKSQQTAANVNFVHVGQLDPLQIQLQQMYQQDFGDSTDDLEPTLSIEDKRAVEIMSKSLKTVNNHYQISLPWKADNAVLPYNRPLAERRLSYLKRKLQKDPELFENYRSKIDDYMKKGYARRIPDEELPATPLTWYIPHHAVGPKFRVVFDCAATYQNTSLNDQLLAGPDHTNSLLGVLLRFRQHLIGIVADIQGMFHQVRVTPEDCNALRFLWWPDHDLEANPADFQMLVHIFGAVSSPSVAGFALRQVAIDYKADFDERVISTVMKSFYVDDCLQSVDLPSEAIELIAQLKLLLSMGGFKLTKFLSNSVEVINSVPAEDRAPSLMNLDLDNLPIERTLGVFWNTASDNFEIRVKLRSKPCTRRGILSMISQIFDPLGFVQIFVLPMKRLLQDLCSQNLSWDSPIPEKCQESWINWLNCLPGLEDVVVPRCLKSRGEFDYVELHCFSDASTVGYGACAYLRFVNCDQSVHCAFVAGKSRVAPLKPMTIPRLELTAAVVASKLRHCIVHELQYEINEVVMWTDSTSVLKYICNTTSRFQTFVANRLSIIHDYTEPAEWRYVDTRRNPADLASRGLMPSCVSQADLWFKGPDFIWQTKENWPVLPEVPMAVEISDPEVKQNQRVCAVTSVLSAQVNNGTLNELMQRYSSWFRLVRAVAWLQRLFYWYIGLIQASDQNFTRFLTAENLLCAEMSIVKFVQRQVFSAVLSALPNHKSFDQLFCLQERKVLNLNHVLHPFRKLSPIVVNGILRVGGRLQKATLPIDSRHQIILPPKHHVTELIVDYYHCREGHCGALHVLAAIRERFWILRGQSYVKSVIGKCVKCRMRKAQPGVQIMAPLPPERITAGKPPFTCVGVDYLGPILVKRARSQVKRYGCIFSCMATRAIHIEIAHALDTNAFLNAIRRFIARRGNIAKIFSDNGSNLVGGEREIRQGIVRWNQALIHKELSQKGIQWHFNPPGASHYGGVWERMVQSIKRILTRLAGNQVLDDDALHTFALEVERIINSRPITPMSDDPEDGACLTPSMLLNMKLDYSFAPDVFVKADGYKKSWRVVQKLADVFWSKWLKSYIPLLQARQKWHVRTPNLNPGDVVLVADDNCVRGLWPKAIVVEAYPDQFGVVRRVKVRTGKNNFYVRDVRKLCLLEAAELKE